jgi:predicted AAA+ superfamily ATPase
MYFQRVIDLNSVLAEKSCFLLGARQTGKSSLVRHQFPDHRVYNLLQVDVLRRLSRQPWLIREQVQDSDKVVIIDEVQLIPELLNEVHFLIEERGIRFLLTGSSARRLRRKGVNLLGGRARWKQLLPLVRCELGDRFDLHTALARGLLPAIYLSDNYREDLQDYIDIYLREEIANETEIRQLPAYSRFLDIAALCHSQVVNYAKIANDAELSPSTVREYFSVLMDTLIISRLPCWQESKKRKASAKDKYYFFDNGVARYLQGRSELIETDDDIGVAFESYLYHELRAHSVYKSGLPLAYWRTNSGIEVDFLYGNKLAIEVKSTARVTEKHLSGLLALKEEGAFANYLLVSRDPMERHLNGIHLLPYNLFLDRLWAGEWS